jgi:hypothetical protein
MRTIFCYVNKPHPLVAKAVEEFAPDAEWIKNNHHRSYAVALTARWDTGEDIVIIEGDKEITPEVIPSFTSCTEPWCTFAYYNYPEPHQQLITVGLGCTKYTAELQSQIPTDEIYCKHPATLPCPDCNGDGCWRYMDTRISFAILNRCIVFAPHVHGRINHHHSYPDDWSEIRGLN